MAYEEDDEAPESGDVYDGHGDDELAALSEALELWSSGDKRKAVKSLAAGIEMCIERHLDQERGGPEKKMGPPKMRMRGKKSAPEALLLMAGKE